MANRPYVSHNEELAPLVLASILLGLMLSMGAPIESKGCLSTRL